MGYSEETHSAVVSAMEWGVGCRNFATFLTLFNATV